MNIEFLENKLKKAFIDLDVSHINYLDSTSTYSNEPYEIFYEDVLAKIQRLKQKGFANVICTESVCMHCYPSFKRVTFKDFNSSLELISFVIGVNSSMNNSFIVEECRNKVIPDSKDGMPF